MSNLKENLSRGILVDPEDVPLLEHYLWDTSSGYASTRINGTLYNLHKIIHDSKNFFTDHANRNKLDNRKENLREATVTQNNHNVGKGKNNTSGFKGVSEHGGSWRYEIMAHGLRERVSGFPTAQHAARAYNEAARKYHGEFAYQNQIEGI